jgi:aminoglycoside 6'-N-acetyltransferase I
MEIKNLRQQDKQAVQQAAELLVAGFKEHWPHAWPNLAAGLAEVREAFGPDRVNKIAVDDQGAVLGWIGGIREYDDHAWELHPLVVRPDHQRRGIGRALVAALETEVAARGGATIYLGTDDEDGMTTLANTDLYPDVWAHVRAIRNLRGHPYEFYQKVGYVIVGVIPDANGPGKPDILMAKRVNPLSSR